MGWSTMRIEVVWGARSPSRKGPRRSLSIERIVDAGIEIAAAEGIEAVSMGRIARHLGTSPMALYRYVESKDELLAIMVDTALGPPPEDLVPARAGWREGLTSWALASMAATRRHPWTLFVPITGPPATPNQVQWMEVGLRCMADTALDEGEKIGAILLLSFLVRSWATLEVTVADPEDDPYTYLLTHVVTPERFPALSAAVAGGAFSPTDSPDTDLRWGITTILDGLEVQQQRRRG